MKKNEALTILEAYSEWSGSYLSTVRNFSERTLNSYVTSLESYIGFLNDEKNVTPDKLCGNSFSIDNINEWLKWLKAKCGNSSVTCNARLAGLKSFVRYLGDKDFSMQRYAVGLKSIRNMKTHVVPIPEIPQSAMKTLFGVMQLNRGTDRRDFTLFYLMYSIGARIDEILSIRVKDLHMDEPDGRNYVIITGKGNKSRRPPILKDVKTVLRRYIQVFHGKNQHADDYLFYSSHGAGGTKKMCQSSINKRLKMHAAVAHRINPAVPEDFHCHMLRHARATHWLEQGLNIIAIQRLMGHANVSTTMRYIFVSLEQKEKALAILEGDEINKTTKKWKRLTGKAKDLRDVFGFKKK